MQNPIIKIYQLRKIFGKTEALQDLTLAVNARTFLTVFGPNGSGKTTLIRILATLSHPNSGIVKLWGFDPKTHGNELRKQIGVVSHQHVVTTKFKLLYSFRQTTLREDVILKPSVVCNITEFEDRLVFLLFILHLHGFDSPNAINLLNIVCC